jgi:membrane-bound lytic murein transglycosylase A
VLAACGPRSVPPSATSPAQSPAPPPATARDLGVQAARLPDFADQDLKKALDAFRLSCPALLKRADASGLTMPSDWRPACEAASRATDAKAFFAAEFAAVSVGDGTGLNTGYYEPELAGSRTHSARYAVPLYRTPPDLVEVDLGQFSESLAGRRIRGRVEGRRLIPYYDRAEIEDGALAGRGLELAWAADPYEAFFLQIQGSGRLRLPDGTLMRVGYDGQNGRDYVGIGKRLREMNALAPGEATMDGIIRWLRAHPREGRELMRENGSYIFFRELKGAGPIGALGVTVTPEVSVAADPKFVPLGAPLWLETSINEPDARSATPYSRLMVAQDTGGAIKGANRLDLFWGAGERARAVAGALSSTGRMTLLLPRASVARLSGHVEAAR